MRILALASCTFILAISILELSLESTSLWSCVFVSLDYAAVLLITACCLMVSLQRNLPILRGRVCGGLFAALAILLTVGLSVVAAPSGMLPASAMGLSIMRTLVACLLAAPFALLLEKLREKRIQCGSSSEDDAAESRGPAWAMVAIGLVLVAVIPFTYEKFLTQYYQTQLSEALRNGRTERARLMALDWSRLAPNDTWQDRSLPQIAGQLQRRVEALHSQLTHLTQNDWRANPGATAGLLLQLDQFESATEVIRPLLKGEDPSPFAWDTYGLILQRQEWWADSLSAYRRALDLWQNAEEHPRRRQGLVSAWRGIAHAQHRSGQVREAEKSYQQLLEIEPTAETHFLLARFYEEEQQTDSAFGHAGQAASLAPAQFAEPANRLINKMQSAHMGCFQIYRQTR